MQKYNILKPELAMYCNSNHCLIYGNNKDGCGVVLIRNFLKVKTNFENHK